MSTVLSSAATDAGRVRENNEDAVRLSVAEEEGAGARGYLIAVADGMGGHQHGEVASSLAVETLFKTFYADIESPVLDRLRAGVLAANAAIVAKSGGTGSSSAMGTTLVAAAVLDDQLTVANVGDSRAYLIRAERATQITNDHSFVAEQVQAGTMTAEEAKGSRHKNIITRALGHQPKIDVDLFEMGLLATDRVVLCTDGVHGHVEPDELASIVLEEAPQAACQRLIDLAMERGSTDNVTVAMFVFEPAQEDVGAGAGSPARRSKAGLVLVLLLAVILGVLVAIAYSQQFFGFFGY